MVAEVRDKDFGNVVLLEMGDKVVNFPSGDVGVLEDEEIGCGIKVERE